MNAAEQPAEELTAAYARYLAALDDFDATHELWRNGRGDGRSLRARFVRSAFALAMARRRLREAKGGGSS